MSHDVFTGSAGMGGQASDGWTHTIPDAVPVMGGLPARCVARRGGSDRWHAVVWFAVTVLCLLVLAAASRPALWLVLHVLGYAP